MGYFKKRKGEGGEGEASVFLLLGIPDGVGQIVGLFLLPPPPRNE